MLPYKIYKDIERLALSSAFMSDKGLQEFLDARPVVCSDIVLYNKERRTIYLATRKHKPAEGPWVIGGQTKRGESAEGTALRRLKAETTLEIDENRLEYLGTVETMWSYRTEPEQTNGRHDLSRVFALDITDAEREAIAENLDNDEYEASDGLKEYSEEELRSAKVRSCLIDYYKEIFG